MKALLISPPSAASFLPTATSTLDPRTTRVCRIHPPSRGCTRFLHNGKREISGGNDNNNSSKSFAQRGAPPPPLPAQEDLPPAAGLPPHVTSPLALLIASQFLLFIGVGAVIPAIPLFGREIGLSGAANGIVISAPAVALLLLAKTGGNLADVAGRKPAMLWGMALIAVSDLGTALANGLLTLIVARLGLGAGRCFSEAGERGMLADISKQAPGLRGRALSAQQAAVALGIAIGAPVGGYVIETYGPRAAFLCVSAAAAVTWLLYGLLPETMDETFSRSRQKEPGDNTDEIKMTDKTVEIESALLGPSEAVDSGKNDTIAQADWMRLLSSNEWRGLALCQCGSSFGFAAKVASIPILASATLPGGALGAGALLSAAGLSGIVGAPVGGWLTDRTSAKDTATLSGFVSATGLILVPFALGLPTESSILGNNIDLATSFMGLGMDMNTQSLAFSAAVILWSLGASSQGPALTALAQELAPAGAEATAMALPRATGDGTYIIAPFILGLVTDNTGSMIPGAECALAGSIMLVGALALGVLGGNNNNPQKSLDEATS